MEASSKEKPTHFDILETFISYAVVCFSSYLVFFFVNFVCLCECVARESNVKYKINVCIAAKATNIKLMKICDVRKLDVCISFEFYFRIFFTTYSIRSAQNVCSHIASHLFSRIQPSSAHVGIREYTDIEDEQKNSNNKQLNHLILLRVDRIVEIAASVRS